MEKEKTEHITIKVVQHLKSIVITTMADKTVVMSGGPRLVKMSNNAVTIQRQQEQKRQRSNPLAAARGNAKRPSSCGIARRVPDLLSLSSIIQQPAE
jgi:hypothetical protein